MAFGIDTHGDALSGAGGVCKAVSIIVVRLPIAKDLTWIAGAAAARNNAAIEPINLCRVAIIDAPCYLDGRARRCGSWGWCWRWSACATAIDVKDIVHVGETNASSRHRLRVAAVWRTDVAWPDLRRWVGTDDEEVVFNCLIRRQHFHDQLECPRRNGGRDRHMKDGEFLIRDADFA